MTATTTATTTALTPTPTTDLPARAAALTGVAGSGFLAALGVLHVVKSDLSPTWRMVSEYAIGTHGWLMAVAFLTLAVACLATVVAVTPLTTDRAGRVGRVALVLTAAALTVAAVATTDPVTATPEQLTTEGTLHGMAAMIGMPAFLVGAIAIHRSLRRRATTSNKALRVATVAAVLAAVVFGASMAVMFDGPPADPSVRIGLQNRLLVLTQAAWLVVAARAARSTRS